MSESDARIGPRKILSSDQTPVYHHKSWVRPGYNPSSPFKSPRKAHYPGPSPSRSDGGPALLSRMDLTDFPYSPNSNPRNQKRHRPGRSFGCLEDSGGLILGNHRITNNTANEDATNRSPSPIGGVTDHGGTLNSHAYNEVDDPDSIPGLHLRAVHNPTVPVSSDSRNRLHQPKLDLVTSSELRPVEGEKLQNREDLASSWSRPSLKERIAPLVKRNAYLRYTHDRHEENNNRASPPVHDKSVDAVMTSAFCDNLTTSLITCQSQLAQEHRFHNAPAIKNPLDTELHVENLPPPATSKSPPAPSSSTNHSFPSGSSSGKTPKEFVVISDQLPREPSIDSTIATDQSTIPIPVPITVPVPFPSPTVSPQSSISNQFASSSDMVREKYNDNPRKRSRSPSSCTRPYKRPRSRSPPPFSKTQDPRSQSPPPSYHRVPPSPQMTRHPSYSYTSQDSPLHSKSPHASPYTPHPSRSPYKLHHSKSPPSQRSKSPPLYTQESPRRREADTAENQRWMSEAHRSRRPPPASEEYSGGSSKKRYLTAFEREELEKAERDEGRGHTETTAHDIIQVVEQAQSGSSTDWMSVDKRTTLSPVPASVITSSHHRSPRAPSLFPAKSDSIKLYQRGQEQHFSAIGSKDGAVSSAKSDPQSRNLASVGNTGAILKPDVRPKEVLTPWRPFGGIPGIWLLMNGSAKPEVFEHSFEISKQVAFEWDLCGVSVSGKSMMGTKLRDAQPSSRLSWKLKCVLVESVDPVRQRLEKPGTAENLVQELSRFESHWPPGGKLIVEVNPNYVSGQTFYAKQLDSGVPFVELKHYIHKGTNLIRFIQLGDLSKYVFILYATYCATPQIDQHALDLGNLQAMLQKARLDNLPGSNQPLFGAHTAHVSVTVNNK